MSILAYVLAIASWPLVTLVSNCLLSVALLPVFNVMYKPAKDARAGFGLADLFQTTTLAVSQVLVFLASKGIFSLLGREATRWICLPFAIWCLAFSIGGLLSGRMGRHINLSWALGLCIGWIIATVWLF